MAITFPSIALITTAIRLYFRGPRKWGVDDLLVSLAVMFLAIQNGTFWPTYPRFVERNATSEYAYLGTYCVPQVDDELLLDVSQHIVPIFFVEYVAFFLCGW